MDVVGEGGLRRPALAWLVMLLHRPPGRPGDAVARTGPGLHLLFLVDGPLDEFIQIPASIAWDNWLETAPMPGLLLLTFGIYHLNQEQRAINAQMHKRERLFREHRLFDNLTPLSTAEYLRRQLDQTLRQADEEQRPLSLLAIDLDDFSRVNQRYGQAEGDLVLQAVAQLLVLNLRHQDLLCRLAGDRFVVLLPDTAEQQARQLAEELQTAVASLAHKTRQHGERLHLRASTAVVMAFDDDAEQLLQRLNLALAKAKQSLPRCA